MKSPYYNPNYSNCWHGDEMFQGLEADVEEVLTAIGSEMYRTADGMTGDVWLRTLDDNQVKDKLIVWLAQNYWREGLEEPLQMLREAIQYHLEG